MEEYKVLITTSGIGSRLGDLTTYTNKCLVRVGDKPAISYIIESYPVNTKFVITLGHYGTHIKQFLKLAYPNYNFKFVNIDKFQGKGSSLGYSILQAKKHLQCPFIFHASDTILTNEDNIPIPSNNWCAGAYKEETSQYRTLRVNNDKVTFINEKGEINYDYPYIGLCGIKDYKLFWKCLEQIPNDHSLSDVHVINKMIKFTDFEFKSINKWLDIGNTTELSKTRKYFGSSIEVLDKQNESIFFFKDFIIKFFYDTTINSNRVKRAETLYPLVPKIISSTENFYKYEKAEGKLFSKSVKPNTFLDFLYWADGLLWVNHPEDVLSFKNKCKKFYIDKSKKRISKYLENNIDPKTINGENILPINELFDKINFEWLCDGISSQFHGDFILDNIIETPEDFTLIDWRQDFGGDLEIGDLYYDLAKLNHNLTVNHGIIEQNLFSPSPDNCYILCNSTLIECKKVLHQFIKDKGYNLNKVELLSSIIWLNMAPLHEYPFNKFLFNFGKYNLHKNLNK
jgi:choline kinase